MTRAALIALALSAPALSACGSSPKFHHLYYSAVSEAPGLASLRPREIRIEKGIAVKARVAAMDDDGEPMGGLALQSSDSTVFEADLGPNRGEFVFYGVEVGSAELDVYSGGDFEASIPVEVVPGD